MNWNDWEFIWRRQEPPAGAAADLIALKATFDAKSRKFSRALFVRDFAEAAAGLFVAAVLAYAGWRMKGNGWPILIAVALVLGVTGFFIRERLRMRRARLGPGASLLAKLEADLAELQRQRQLLWNVWPWYLGPVVAAWAIFGITLLVNQGATGREMLRHPFVITTLSGYCLLCCGLFWAVWRVNRRAVRTQIDPRIEELEKLRRNLAG